MICDKIHIPVKVIEIDKRGKISNTSPLIHFHILLKKFTGTEKDRLIMGIV